MYDPSTVAFEIKYPWRRAPSAFWPKGHRDTFVTIWHEDPELPSSKTGLRSDDSCGWFRPPTTAEEREKFRKIGGEVYSTIFEKQCRTREGADYAHICYEPTTRDAIYWSWRRIKREHTNHAWQFGGQRNYLSAAELEEIYSLSSNPVDNLRASVARIQDQESFSKFFLNVYSLYRRFCRPWYRHPRWHFWHWRLQVHPWQKLRRRLFSRCATCGKPFTYGYSPTTNSWDRERPRWFRSESDVHHMECLGIGGPVKDPAP